jgi:hypothetical protein
VRVQNYDFVEDYESSNYDYISGEELEYNNQYHKKTTSQLDIMKK